MTPLCKGRIRSSLIHQLVQPATIAAAQSECRNGVICDYSALLLCSMAAQHCEEQRVLYDEPSSVLATHFEARAVSGCNRHHF